MDKNKFICFFALIRLETGGPCIKVGPKPIVGVMIRKEKPEVYKGLKFRLNLNLSESISPPVFRFNCSQSKNMQQQLLGLNFKLGLHFLIC